jgi:hypothetical protein
MSDDELDELLAPKSATTDRREAIFMETLPELGRRRRYSWLPCGIGLVALGFGAGWYVKPVPPPERIVETVFERVPVEAPSHNEPFAELSPGRLELEAERTDSAILFRRAGDAYLKASAIESAIRCYRQYLEGSGADGLAFHPDDSWLLASIKISHRKENDHANAGS